MKRNPTTKKLKSLIKLINSLTQDEDAKQELILLYLEGNASAATIEKLAARINVVELVESNTTLIDTLIKSELDQDFITFLESLTDLQREVVLLHSSGVSIEDISRYNGISQQKVDQIIKSIRNKDGAKTALYR